MSNAAQRSPGSLAHLAPQTDRPVIRPSTPGDLRAAACLVSGPRARADGSLRHVLVRLSRIDVLVIDDWAMAPLNESERREVWEICEDR
jgi:hypothetical protein